MSSFIIAILFFLWAGLWEKRLEIGEEKRKSMKRNNSNDQWYTPAQYIEMVREILDTIDLDPASCAEANQIVQANRFFTKEQDGLKQSWDAENIFLNPPYSKMLPWVEKLLFELSIQPKLQAILLANVCTDTKWFEAISEASEFIGVSICFVRGRIKFHSPSRIETHNTPKNSPKKPSMFVCFGNPDSRRVFKYTFDQIGQVVDL